MVQRFILCVCFAALYSAAAPSATSAEEPRVAASLLPRKTIDTRKLGINAFVNDPRFGTVQSQMNEVKNTLRLKFVRVLFAWSNEVQPTPGSRPDYSFYDDIARNIPRGSDALVILTGMPDWMSDPRNWIDGDPRKTILQRWIRPTIRRYRSHSRIVGWQFWNEPNDTGNPHNSVLEFSSSPARYVEFLRESARAARRLARKKKIVGAATTAIAQNFPDTLEYNQALVAAGVERIVDVFGVHYYGTRLEVLLLGGAADFLRSIRRPIWITESGEKGTLNQREYAETMWPYLLQEVPRIRRIYQYQFTEATPAETTWGLKNLTPGSTVSDLYIYLRDR